MNSIKLNFNKIYPHRKTLRSEFHNTNTAPTGAEDRASMGPSFS